MEDVNDNIIRTVMGMVKLSYPFVEMPSIMVVDIAIKRQVKREFSRENHMKSPKFTINAVRKKAKDPIAVFLFPKT